MHHYGILGWIVIGGIAGAIAKLLMPGRDPGGCIITILLGIAGALLAGWIGHRSAGTGTGEGAGFIAAIVGAFMHPVHLSPDHRTGAVSRRAAFTLQPWPMR